MLGFQTIKGQPQVVEILKSALKRRHLAHGYLFSGPAGVGKKATAQALAAFLNCQSPDWQAIESCGHCPSCLKIKNNEHADVSIIEPEGTTIKIEQIRQLNAKVALRA